MKEAKGRFPVSLIGYCLMPNHVHFIFRAQSAENIPAYMQWISGCYSRHYHSNYGTSGHLWQGRFKSLLIDREEYLIIALRYIESNPKRAGLVDSNGKWEWSSLGDHCARDYRRLTDAPPFYLADGWLELVEMPLTAKEFEVVRISKEGQSPAGTVP
jgi:putative transposase